MQIPQEHDFTLTAYPGVETAAVRRIGGRISRTPGALSVSFLLEGDLERLRVPEPRIPSFADELWRHTCFEIFIARKGEPGYYEFNFSPSGEWAVYAFSHYRERVPLDPALDLSAIDPRLKVRRSAGKLELDVVVRLDCLGNDSQSKLLLGLSAVIEARDGTSPSLSYWALNHPGPKPDFHHADAFTLELHEIRN